ncbi:ATP-binding cassette domain-containing protein [Erysipelotrichaceae bacterium HCN-30851]
MLLRILIGLDRQNEGEILTDGKDISSLKPNERQMGIVFQNYALFPNMTVFDVTNREIMKKELKDIQRKFSSTMIFIAHEQEEAFYRSDCIMVMGEDKRK